MPWQHLKKAMAKHRARNATAARSHLTGLDEIVAPISKNIINNMATKELRVYNHLATGGAWAEQHLQDMGLSNGRCKHCGAKAETITHVTWECPEINKHRQHTKLAKVDHTK